MQRLARLLLAPQRRALVLQKKEIGTPVDFTHSRELALNSFIFQDEILGIYAYQAVPATVDASIRNAFIDGAISDLQNYLAANGFQLQYALITWNETSQGASYYITDFVVGVVVKAASTMNMNANKLIQVLSYASWYKNLLSKLVMPWKAWILIPQPSTRPLLRWEWDAVSGPFQLSSLSGVPSPPSVEETRSHFVNDGQVNGALGEFVRSMLDDGYQVTLVGYRVLIGYETIRTWQYRDRTYAEYRTYTRLSVDYKSIPEPALSTRTKLITPALMLAIGKAVAYILAAILVGAAVFIALYNLTTQRKDTYGWVQNPETGEWKWEVTSSEVGAPTWWGDVLTYVVIGTIVVIGGLVIIPPVIQAFRGKKK